MNPQYTMQLDMRVLKHLGIKLYSNTAAVVSELVANSWDADATEVSIKFDTDNDRIEIRDNGLGMSVQDLNNRFLHVGYDKRGKEGGISQVHKRPFMGRKGIGKLSVFSIAECVEIHTVKDAEKNALRIELADLERAVESGKQYHPEAIPFDASITAGTTLLLGKLVKKRTGITIGALRKRLARRFSVIGQQSSSAAGFDVSINGAKLGYKDRDDIRSLEYLWEFGPAVIPINAMPALAQRFIVSDNAIPGHPDWVVRGWFGTARKPADLEQDDDAGSMRNIVVLSRGRLIQESILDRLGFNRIFGSYVTGVIEADFLDLDDKDDIATSDRQRLLEDDPRVQSLRHFMRKALVEASETWGEVRKQKKALDAETAHPVLGEWIKGLPVAQQPAARSVIGLIEGLPLDDEREDDRIELFRSGVLAFERLRLKEAAHRLERLKSLDSDHLLPLLATQDNYEAAMYGDIIKTRVEAIRKFRDLQTSHAKEKVLQEHLFDHLWLLDAGWERAAGSPIIEENLRKQFPKEFDFSLSQKEKTGRIDIKYRTNAGVHIIVELKKYERSLSHLELQEQGQRYQACLVKLLEQKGETSPRVEVVFVLGRPVQSSVPAAVNPNFIDDSFRTWGARVQFYDRLIENALAAYDDFLKANAQASRVDNVLRGISRNIDSDSVGPKDLLPIVASAANTGASRNAKPGRHKKSGKKRP